MENKELQLELAKSFWKDSKGNPKKHLGLYGFSPEEELEIEYLLKKGALRRDNGSYLVCSATREFINNNGKTNLELEKEKEEQRKEETLKLSREANETSKKSMWISGGAFFFSILSLVINFLKS